MVEPFDNSNVAKNPFDILPIEGTLVTIPLYISVVISIWHQGTFFRLRTRQINSQRTHQTQTP